VNSQKVLILGATGMLGHTLFGELTKFRGLDVYGTARGISGLEWTFEEGVLEKIRTGVDAENFDTIIRAMASVQPDIVINCIGLIKQDPLGKDPLSAITVNAQLPHRISLVCKSAGARMIHFSTDCAFDGKKGAYTEKDPSNAKDLYGRTKYLGEVEYSHCITLRTSIIGHELKGKRGLVEWFLSQDRQIRGFTNAIYTGFPTVEMARIVSEFVIPNPHLEGLYHVSSEPISKYELLKLIARKYSKQIEIEPYDEFYCDRSLDSTLFRDKTGYVPPSWQELVEKMHRHYATSKAYHK
jgi:dTDP-4-dehydrorhamnose reductase